MKDSIPELLSRLTLEQKCRLLAGRSPFHLVSFPEEDIPEVIVTDGPLGVRTMPKEREPERISGPATAMPSSTAQAAGFNLDLIRQMTNVLAEETRALGCDLLLAPGVNVARDPRSGRTFEYFSEDPLLSAMMGAAYVSGLQEKGVACCVKHFVANDLETNRFNSSSEMDERTLREVHLFPFEWISRHAEPWSMMPAYNRLNGVHCTEHREMLEIFRRDCGFDGAFISDWGAIHTCEEAILAGCDLQMPGPDIQRGELLAHAVRFGKVPPAAVDACAGRVLQLIQRCVKGRGVFENPQAHTADHAALSQRVAEEGMVLLKNAENTLPLERGEAKTVALIGPNGSEGCLRGGGSSRAFPDHWVSLEEGLREVLGNDTELIVERGCENRLSAPLLQGESLKRPSDGGAGFDAGYFNSTDCTGEPVLTEPVETVCKGFFRPDTKGLAGLNYSIRFEGEWTAPSTGRWLFELGQRDAGRLWINDELVIDAKWDLDDFRFLQPATVHRNVEEGETLRLRVEFYRASGEFSGSGHVTLSAMEDPEPEDDDRIQRACDAARRADVVVLALGNPPEYESEGFDRPDLRLTGGQDALAEAILAERPDAVVVLTVGSPIEMPWANLARTVLLANLPGQNGGHAIARTLFGLNAPCGRLPLTWPRRLEDIPSWPPSGVYHVVYGEHVFNGYRGYDARKIEPLFSFGHGLTYSALEYADLRMPESASAGNPVTVSVTIRNAGTKASGEVVQLYVAPPPEGLKVPWPVRRLAGFTRFPVLEPGQEETREICLDPSAFGFFDPDEGRWVYPPGEFTIEVGKSSRDIVLTQSLSMKPAEGGGTEK